MKFRPSHFLTLLLFTACLFSNPEELREKAKKGIAYQEQGRCAHAIKIFKEVIGLKPHWYSLYNRVATCFQKLGYDEIAMKYYRKTLSYDPVNSLATVELQKYLKVKKDLQETPEDVVPEESNGRFFSSQEIQQMQKRLWFLRAGKLMTSLRDGRDLREYSSMSFLDVFPERGGNDGFPVLMQERYDTPRIIFYLFPNKGTLIRLTSDEYDCSLPLYIAETNELLFVARKVTSSPKSAEIKAKYSYEEGYSIYGVNLKADAFKQKPKIYLKKFYNITDLAWGAGNNIFIVGQKESQISSRIFEWSHGKNMDQIRLGIGNDQNIQKSPDGRKLVSLVRGPDAKYIYKVIDLESGESFNLTSIRSSRLMGVWSPDSKYFIFASSNSGLKDRWETTVYKVAIPQLLISEVFESNFLYNDFSIDESGEMLYFLSNYDGNYEAYRYNMKTKSQDRLTISTDDETRLGFWTFSGI